MAYEIQMLWPAVCVCVCVCVSRLQDKVQETIEALRLAGIKVWVLTGDKHETGGQREPLLWSLPPHHEHPGARAAEIRQRVRRAATQTSPEVQHTSAHFL